MFLCGLGTAQPYDEAIGCHLEASAPLSRFSAEQRALLAKLNHADAAHLANLKRIVVPNRWDPDELAYSPMPRAVPELSAEKKAIVVDIPAQVFGAYESGQLVRWGPVSTGDRRHQTPSGTYHLNWHARVQVSTENPTWIMPWYFNFANGQGLALHEYALPGRPASHGCARMLAIDAKWLFDWGEGWTLDADTRELVEPGTLVLVLGTYNFSAPQPWLQPKWWTRGVTLPGELIADQN
jgi:hypothetical protein